MTTQLLGRQICNSTAFRARLLRLELIVLTNLAVEVHPDTESLQQIGIGKT